MKKNPKESAFSSRPDDNLSDIGLTKREYFAAMAMQGLMVHDDKNKQCIYLASIAVEYADALIAVLNRD